MSSAQAQTLSERQRRVFTNHLMTLRAGASQATSVSEMSRWISDNTFLNGREYSYRYHEYQERILNSGAKKVVIRKCSQVGITELAVRKALGMCGMMRGFTTIYTLPTATFASVIAKTRVNPVINESPFLSTLLTGSDSIEVKQFANGSYLYLKGAASSNAPISIPADLLVHDELDFSDSNVIDQYQSRLTHSPHKLKILLSTPTIPDKGIDKEFQHSKRYFSFCKCNHCGHQFIPSYYDHVKIPGYRGELVDVLRTNIHTIAYEDARVECPNCGKAPSLMPEHREWVCENPDDNFSAEGFQVSPFDAPVLISPSYLVEASTIYTHVSEFINFNLGLPHYSRESTLSPEEVRGTIIPNRIEGGSSFSVMGVDLGKTCHVIVAKCSFDGAMQVIHKEQVPLNQLRERYQVLRALYRVRTTVIDSLPYTDMVLTLQSLDPNLWACVYTATKGVHLYTIKDYGDVEIKKGEQRQRQMNVARDRTFDSLMEYVRSGEFSVLSCGLDDVFVEQCTDMRRIKEWEVRSQGTSFKWIKSDARNDHFWFALSYAYLAKFVIGTVTGEGGGFLPLISTFRVLPARQITG